MPAVAPDAEAIATTRRQDIDAICTRCAANEHVKRYQDASGWVWSHGPSRLDECPAGPIWELVRADIAL